jgi:hypothetical protein
MEGLAARVSIIPPAGLAAPIRTPRVEGGERHDEAEPCRGPAVEVVEWHRDHGRRVVVPV